MRKKGIDPAAKRLAEHYAQFPDWYWKHGLHDAEILSISELEFIPDYIEKNPGFNCLEIALNSKNAIYERDIQTIRLYNYKIKTPDVKLNCADKRWWISDAIKDLNNQQYSLDIEIESASGSRDHFIVEFEIPEIERK